MNSLADSAANPSGSVGLGASVVVNTTQDAVLADLDRNVTAGGPVSVTDVATSSSQATSVASEQGAGKSDKTADQQSQSQSSLAHSAGGSNSANVSAPPTSNSQMTSPSSSAASKSGGSKGADEDGHRGGRCGQRAHHQHDRGDRERSHRDVEHRLHSPSGPPTSRAPSPWQTAAPSSTKPRSAPLCRSTSPM